MIKIIVLKMCTQPENVAEFEFQNDKSIYNNLNFLRNKKNMRVIKFAIFFSSRK